MSRPRVSFGIIVLNGEPFLPYCIRALYPFAHQILVVEGACPGAAAVATPEGHSTDGTLETLRRMRAEEDPEGKITVITAEDRGHSDGFWPGEKDEQSRAYATAATGDYLWQVDSDEFYRADDMARVLDMLEEDPSITAMSFHQVQFWGGFDAFVDGWYLRRGGQEFHRLFKWGPGYRYMAHRPPTVVDDQGRDVRRGHWLSARETRRMGLHLYHYSLVLPSQVLGKSAYYAAAAWCRRKGLVDWARQAYMELDWPLHCHNVYDLPGWLERFTGEHPEQIRTLIDDLATGRLNVELRRTDDIDALLRRRWYRAAVTALKVLEPFDRMFRRCRRRMLICEGWLVGHAKRFVPFWRMNGRSSKPLEAARP
ncbi:MAG: glycosyltransferase family 2 protein [Phycisphaeraceae bacterium]|nr:glycosyltransferase family 2 protein [Phycisphaeraceae bacterium]